MQEQGSEGGSIAERRRVDVIEARSAIPERIPSGMRQIFAKDAGIGDKCALDGRPVVEIFKTE